MKLRIKNIKRRGGVKGHEGRKPRGGKPSDRPRKNNQNLIEPVLIWIEDPEYGYLGAGCYVADLSPEVGPDYTIVTYDINEDEDSKPTVTDFETDYIDNDETTIDDVITYNEEEMEIDMTVFGQFVEDDSNYYMDTTNSDSELESYGIEG